jgi:diguanylate cyclase (GGDEF)-like protein
LLVVLLVVASALAGVRWKSDVNHERAAAFSTTASAVASSVATTLQRQTDLTKVEQALVALNPDMTNAEFSRWFNDLDAAKRYAGGVGFGFVKRVPADQLRAFAAEMEADSSEALPIHGTYAVFPGGTRSEYCLLRLAFWLGPSGELPPTLDYCAPTIPTFGTSPAAATLIAARDTGELTLTTPVPVYPGVLFAFLPVYEGDATPSTVEARRQSLIGWVAGTFDGNAIIRTAEAGRHNLRVDVIAKISNKNVTLASDGTKLDGPVSSLTVPVGDDGTWWVTVSGNSLGGTSAATQGIVVFGLGLAISLLIFGVMQVLLRSRGRALRLVREQTEELRYRALHDDLTGLPNRALIMDRVEQLLGRTRRQGIASAVLFIDLDSFKDVNDTYGHAAGDALLRAVADRLSGSIRETDTAGRIGGDEFIVLLEGASLTDGVPTVAQRLLDTLEEPFALTELPGVTLTVRASVGVADVDGDSPDAVLRNADMALYEAKAAGKSRFMVFSD